MSADLPGEARGVTRRPALLVSSERLASAQAVWDHWAVFGAIPEVHVIDTLGRFLTADEARVLAPGFALGLGYPGTFFDALQAARLSLVFPLLARTDGAIPGLLEFMGVPYLGCGITGAVLAHDSRHGRAVLESLGLAHAGLGVPADVRVAVLGNQDPSVGSAGDPEAEGFCRKVYQGLGLSGWALVGAARVGDGWRWTSVEIQPDLGEGSPFLASLEARGLDLAAVLERVTRWGLARYEAQASLKRRFREKI